MLQPGRIFSSGTGYRYGFNGKEKNNEVSGDGISYDYGNRIYDTKISRFLSVDRYARRFANESNYIYASNNPVSAKDINGDSTYLVIYGAGYLNYSMAGAGHDVGSGFLLNAQALKKKIESNPSFNPNRDEVVIVYAPTSSRFTAATNQKYKSGKITSLTVFSHGYGLSGTNGTNTGGISLGGEKPGDKRPDGTTTSKTEAEAQKNNYDLREINGNNFTSIDKTNFEPTAVATFYGCWIGGDQPWTDQQVKDFSLAQKLSDHMKVTVLAFTGSGLFKTNKGKPVYDGTMIRAIDEKTQKVKLSTFKPNSKPTVIRR